MTYFHRIISALMLLASLLGVTTSAQAVDYRKQRPGNTTVNVSQAQAAAVHFQPGHITAQHMERYRGGSGLRYSFTIRSSIDAKLYKVGVDTDTGMIVENKRKR